MQKKVCRPQRGPSQQSNTFYLTENLLEINVVIVVFDEIVGVIFATHISPTKQELEKRRIRAFEVLDEAFPCLLTKLLGNNFKTGVGTILEILQNSHYNKQVSGK